MAKNLVYKDGNQLKFHIGSAAGSELNSGDPFVVGQIPAVAMADEDADGYVVGRMVGVFELNVTGETTPGTAIYFHTGTNVLNVTADSGVLFGYALETKAAAAGVIKVLLARS